MDLNSILFLWVPKNLAPLYLSSKRTLLEQLRIGLVEKIGANNPKLSQILDMEEGTEAEQALLRFIQFAAWDRNLMPTELIDRCLRGVVLNEMKERVQRLLKPFTASRVQLDGDTPARLDGVILELDTHQQVHFNELLGKSKLSPTQLAIELVLLHIVRTPPPGLLEPTLPTISDGMSTDEALRHLEATLEEAARLSGTPERYTLLAAIQEQVFIFDPMQAELSFEQTRQEILDAAQRIRDA